MDFFGPREILIVVALHVTLNSLLTAMTLTIMHWTIVNFRLAVREWLAQDLLMI